MVTLHRIKSVVIISRALEFVNLLVTSAWY
jgi:hypothetical protein